jgi:uncharacterized membrane protein YbhN (UPF0104 family)
MAAAVLARGAAALRNRVVVAVAALLSLAASFLVVRCSLGDAVDRLPSARPVPLALCAAALLASLASSAGAWRSAIAAAGATVGRREAWGCYGLGSLGNAVLPAQLGEAVRVGLFASRLPEPGRTRLSARALAVVSALRLCVTAVVLTAAAVAGLLPLWAAAAPAGVTLALAAAARALDRRLAWPVVGWLALGTLSRLAAIAFVLAAFGVPAPLGPTLVSFTALGAAGSLPFAPGSTGVAGAAMALAIRHDGVDAGTAAAAAIAFHVLETLASCAFGATGALALSRVSRSRDAQVPAPRGVRALLGFAP